MRVHVDERTQEQKQRYHRNAELPAQTSFVTPASPAPGAASAARSVVAPPGVQVFICSESLPGAIREELILNSDNGEESFGEGAKSAIWGGSQERGSGAVAPELRPAPEPGDGGDLLETDR